MSIRHVPSTGDIRTPDIELRCQIKNWTVMSGFVFPYNKIKVCPDFCLAYELGSSTHVRIGIRP